MPPIWIVGDVHGEYDVLLRILRDAGLIDRDSNWCGRDAHLWFTGDFTDRGQDGFAVLDFVMRLQHEATEAGGHLGAVLGNHDALIVAAARFADRPSSGPGGTFLAEWIWNGGHHRDLAHLTSRHIRWVTHLPALALVCNRLLMHADSMLYLRYGSDIRSVNAALRSVLTSHDHRSWDRLLGQFTSRYAFAESRNGRVDNARLLLATFGGEQVVHGHTPIARMARVPSESVREPYIYSDGLCVNVDGGLYLGGPGFAWRVLQESSARTPPSDSARGECA